MSLQLLPLELTDFETLISQPNLYEPGDDLVGPPTPICFPVNTKEDALLRSTFHFAKQRLRFISDPTVRYMKVIDTSSPKNEIVSIARWHFYPQGYDFASNIAWETHQLPVTSSSLPDHSTLDSSNQYLAPSPPSGFNIPLHNHILTSRDSARKSWIPVNKPCWILMHMVTRPSCRGRGAAKLLVGWGMARADEEGVPAYLEAGVMGKPLYEKMGWQQVGDLLEVDLKKHGMDLIFVMCKMAYYPQKS